MMKMAIVLAMITFAMPIVSAHPSERLRTWQELPDTIAKAYISLVLPDGTRLRGVGLGTDGNELLLDVRRSSNHALHPRGRTRIPRAQVSTIDVRFRREEPPNIKGAAIGTAVGGVAGGLSSLQFGETGHDGLSALLLFGGMAVGGLVGHYLFDHDAVDSSHLVITVLPAQAPELRRQPALLIE